MRRRRMFAASIVPAAAFWVTSAYSPATRAHSGTGAEILGVASDEAGAVRAVRMQHGLAALDGEGLWRFVCPETWGGPAAARALGLGGGTNETILVIGAACAFEIGLDGLAVPRPAPGIRALSTLDLVRAGGAVLALASEPSGAIVVAFERGSAHPILVQDSPIQSIAGDAGGFFAGVPVEAGLQITEHASDGRERARWIAHSDETAGARVSLASTGEDLFAVFARPDDFVLGKIVGSTIQVIATSTAPILGPVRAGEDVWLVQQGSLARVRDSEIEVIDRSELLSCLEQGDGRVYGCARTKLYAFGPGGTKEAVFDLSSLKGPRLDQLDPDARAGCEFEWSVFASEAGLDPTLPEAGASGAGAASSDAPGPELDGAPSAACRCVAASDRSVVALAGRRASARGAARHQGTPGIAFVGLALALLGARGSRKARRGEERFGLAHAAEERRS